MQLPRPAYVVWRLLENIGSAFSRFLNSLTEGGSTHQTTSARSWVDSHWSARWALRANRIDRLFRALGGGPDHTLRAWAWEVENSLTSLDRNSELPSDAFEQVIATGLLSPAHAEMLRKIYEVRRAETLRRD